MLSFSSASLENRITPQSKKELTRELERNMRPKTVKVYENDKIKVVWRPDRCVHSGNCVTGSHRVFNVQRRPWVNINAADVDEIKRIIDTCPSGALSYELPDQAGSGKSSTKKSRAS